MKVPQPDLKGHKHGSMEEGEKSGDRLSAQAPAPSVFGVLSWAVVNLTPFAILFLSQQGMILRKSSCLDSASWVIKSFLERYLTTASH